MRTRALAILVVLCILVGTLTSVTVAYGPDSSNSADSRVVSANATVERPTAPGEEDQVAAATGDRSGARNGSDGALVTGGGDVASVAFTPPEDPVSIAVSAGASDEPALQAAEESEAAEPLAPEIVLPAEATAYEGARLTLTGSVVDPSSTSWTARAICDGDTPSPEPRPNHWYTVTVNADGTFSLKWILLDNGVYPMTVEVTDESDLVATATVVVTVLNVAPVIDIPGLGETTTLTMSDGTARFAYRGDVYDPGESDTWSGTVNWGDGGPDEVLSLAADKRFSLEHVYTSAVDYLVAVTVTDDKGVQCVDTFHVVIEADDETPSAPQSTQPARAAVAEGVLFTCRGSFSDHSSRTWAATVDYGDGSEVQALEIGRARDFTLRHTYRDDGVYIITVHVADDNGFVSTAHVEVTVINMAPSVRLGHNVTLHLSDGEAEFTGRGSFVDTGADVWRALVVYGDGTVVLALSLDDQNGFELEHTYKAAGTYTVTVTVLDDDGGEGNASMTVRVRDGDGGSGGHPGRWTRPGSPPPGGGRPTRGSWWLLP